MSTELPTNIQAVLDDILADPYYAGSPSLLNVTEWYRDGTVDRLIAKRESPDDPPVEIEVRFDGELVADGFWLYPCGGWRAADDPSNDKPRTWATPFFKAKANARVVAARRKALADTWPAITAGMNALMRDIRTKAPSPRNAAIKNSLFEGAGIKIRHALFEELAHEEGENGELVPQALDDSATLGPDFAIGTWPTKFQTAGPALKELVAGGKYKVCALPAWTASKKLITPSEYESRLRGACVDVRVSISREYIHNAKADNFYADIRSIIVIDMPPPPVGSPSKKRGLGVAPQLLRNLKQRIDKAPASTTAKAGSSKAA